MEFGIAAEVSLGIEDRTGVIYALSDEIQRFLADREYGPSLKRIGILVICVAPEFDFFPKVRKPRYTAHRRYIRDGVEFEEDRFFSFDLKLDYEKFRSQSDTRNKGMLALEILNSLSNLDALPKKAQAFDKERFKDDMKTFVFRNKLLPNASFS